MPQNMLFCSECDYKSNRKFNLRKHILSNHLPENTSSQSKVRCSFPNCSKYFRNRKLLIDHLISVHEETIEEKNLQFESSTAFLKWKTLLESQNFCRYVCKFGSKTSKDGLCTRRYYCHRDGHFHTRVQTRKKLMKSQGSNKINASCPSSITFRQHSSGAVDIRFITTHCGHDATNIGRLTLTQDERAAIAEKIAAGVNFDRILDDIRNSISDLRVPSATIMKQDLRNIVRDFNLDPSRSHSNDAVSVEIWFQKVNKHIDDSSLNPIIYYKRQGEFSSTTGNTINQSIDDSDATFDSAGDIFSQSDDKNDIILIISTKFQREMLQQFGNNIICIDSTHGTNSYDFNLTTLLVVDEFGAGVPGAFCISNKKNSSTWAIFFQKLKAAVGVLTPKVFMSDDDESFYKAWTKEMSAVQCRLLCTWHVDRNWRKNVVSMVKNTSKRAEVYKALQILQKEVNSQDFQLLMQGFVTNLQNDEDTAPFARYFLAYYVNRAPMWAYCFRKGCGINTNMRLESLHKVFKYFYLHGRKNKRLDKCIEAMLRFVRDSFFRRVRKKFKHQRPANLQNIKRSHNMVVEDVQITEIAKIWTVPSYSNKNLRYEVEQIMENIETCSSKCLAICEDCSPRICIHTFSCECVDYLIKSNICKHIHACVKFLSPNYLDAADTIIPAAIEPQDDENVLTSLNAVFEGPKNCPGDFEKLCNKVEAILGYLKKSECDPCHQYSAEKVLTMTRYLDRVLDLASQPSEPSEKTVQNETSTQPCHTKISPQIRFESTKKKRKAKNESTLVKPLSNEKMAMKTFLMNHGLEEAENISPNFDHTYTTF